MSARFVFGSSAPYLAVMVTERAVALLMFPVLTRILTPADYGAILLVSNIAALVNPLFAFSLCQALPSLFSNTPSNDRRAVSTTIILSIGCILFVCYVMVAIWSRPISLYFLRTDANATAIAVGALASCLTGCTLTLGWVVRLTERHRLYALAQLPALAVQVGLIIVFIMTGTLSVVSLYTAVATAGLIATASYAIVLRFWLTGRFDWSQLGKAGRIGAQMLAWQFAIILTLNSAAFFLTRTGRVEETGLFMIAFAAANLLLTAASSFDSAWTPYVLLRKDQPDIAATQRRVFNLYSAALLAGTAILCLFSHELFIVLAGPHFRESYHLVPPLALVCCLYCFANSFAQGLQARQRNIHYTWIGLATATVLLALVVPLVKVWGQYGIVAAMAGGFATMLVMLQVFSNRLMPVHYPWARHGLMWLIAIGMIVYVYPLELGWFAAAAKLAALAGIAALPFLFGVVRLADIGNAGASLLAMIR